MDGLARGSVPMPPCESGSKGQGCAIPATPPPSQEVVKEILHYGANDEAHTPDGLTPMVLACDNKRGGQGAVEVIKLLRAHGAEIPMNFAGVAWGYGGVK